LLWYKLVSIHEQYGITGGSAAEIAASVEAAVRSGTLAPGDRLPSVRALAHDVGVSHTTAAAAVAALARRGVVVTDGRRGTFIAPRTPLPTPDVELPQGVNDLANGNPDPRLLPPLPALDRKSVWPRLYGELADDPELIASFRREFEHDGLDATALTLANGAMDAVERVLAVHLLPGDTVAVEDPGHPPVHDLVAAMGLRRVPITVDELGPQPEAVRAALAAGASALVITPRAHNPTGAALDEQRATQLRATLAEHPDVVVVEDDHAAHLAGSPPLTVTSQCQRWAVIRSVSKTLGPDLRLAALAGDPATIDSVLGRRLLGAGWVSHILQRLTLTIRDDPQTPAIIQQAADRYRDRRAALLDALADHGITAHGRTGLYVWVPVTHEMPVTQALLDEGWAVIPGERFRLTTPPAVRIAIARMSPDHAPHIAHTIAQTRATNRRSRSP
jgi:DNA-binding transcriptional MocR family regulator